MESVLKPKLSIDQQIEHMKSKGILFTIEDEEYAAEYLTSNTYYFKLKAYCKLYDKDKEGKYIGLEFAYLRDLATIDSLFRRIIFKISVDIEHYLKVAMLKDFNDSDEDGYSIIETYKNMNPKKIEDDIEKKSDGKACSNLVNKYKDNFAIWNIIEVLSFSDFQYLYDLFYMRNREFKHPQENQYKRVPYHFLFNPVRLLRNAAAHNNCLISSLKVPYVNEDKFNFNREINKFFGDKGIKNKRLNTQLNKPLIHDFCVMLYLYHQIAPQKAQVHAFNELYDFLKGRAVKNKNYYLSHSTLCSAYEFIVQVVEVFMKEVQNNGQVKYWKMLQD